MIILVVDGSAIRRRIVLNSLAGLEGATFIEADHAEGALHAIKRCEFDLVIVEWTLQGMTGLDFAATLRTQQPYLPILMLTNTVSPLDVAMAIKAGITNLVVRPFSPEIMKDKVQTAVANWF
jgi:two-component system chemotaxis response regulator CheY